MFRLDGPDNEDWFGIPEVRSFLRELPRTTNADCLRDLALLVELIDLQISVPSTDPLIELENNLSVQLERLREELSAILKSTGEELHRRALVYTNCHGNTLNGLFAPHNDGKMKSKSENLPYGIDEDMDFYGDLGKVIYTRTFTIWKEFLSSSLDLIRGYAPGFNRLQVKLESFKQLLRSHLRISRHNVKHQLCNLRGYDLAREIFSDLWNAAKSAQKEALSKLRPKFPATASTPSHQHRLSEMLISSCNRTRTPKSLPVNFGDEIWAPVDATLRDLGLQRLPTEGGGNCALIALCFGVGIEVDSHVLREILLDFLLASGWELEAQAVEAKMPLEKFVASLRELGWCGEMMLSAFAKVFDCKVRIIDPEGEIMLNKECTRDFIVTVAYNGFNHYECVAPNEEVTTIETTVSNTVDQPEEKRAKEAKPVSDLLPRTVHHSGRVEITSLDSLLSPELLTRQNRLCNDPKRTDEQIKSFWNELHAFLKGKHEELAPAGSRSSLLKEDVDQVDLSKIEMVTLYEAGKARAHKSGRAGLGDTAHLSTGQCDHDANAGEFCIFSNGLLLDLFKWLCETLGWKYANELLRYHLSVTYAQLISLPSLRVIRCCSKKVFKLLLSICGAEKECGRKVFSLGEVIQIGRVQIWGTYHPMYKSRDSDPVAIQLEASKHREHFVSQCSPLLHRCPGHPCQRWLNYNSVDPVSSQEIQNLKGTYTFFYRQVLTFRSLSCEA